MNEIQNYKDLKFQTFKVGEQNTNLPVRPLVNSETLCLKDPLEMLMFNISNPLFMFLYSPFLFLFKQGKNITNIITMVSWQNTLIADTENHNLTIQNNNNHIKNETFDDQNYNNHIQSDTNIIWSNRKYSVSNFLRSKMSDSNFLSNNSDALNYNCDILKYKMVQKKWHYNYHFILYKNKEFSKWEKTKPVTIHNSQILKLHKYFKALFNINKNHIRQDSGVYFFSEQNNFGVTQNRSITKNKIDQKYSSLFNVYKNQLSKPSEISYQKNIIDLTMKEKRKWMIKNRLFREGSQKNINESHINLHRPLEKLIIKKKYMKKQNVINHVLKTKITKEKGTIHYEKIIRKEVTKQGPPFSQTTHHHYHNHEYNIEGKNQTTEEIINDLIPKLQMALKNL